MPDAAQLGLIQLMMIVASGAAWWWIVSRWRAGRSAVEIEPTRELPWDIGDVLFILAIFLATNILAAHWLLERESADENTTLAEVEGSSLAETPGDSEDEESSDEAEATSEHPVIQLLANADSAEVLVLAFFVVAIAAPLWEEFLFRLILLGWLAKMERRIRRRIGGHWPYGLVALFVTSLFFAMMHFRSESKPMDTDDLVGILQVTGIANCASLVIGVLFLRARYQVTWQQLGYSSRRLGHDMAVAVVGFFAIVTPLLFLQLALRLLLPGGFAPDPIPLFVLAMVFGYLYLRTGRITSCILLHVALNTFSLASALAYIHLQSGVAQ